MTSSSVSFRISRHTQDLAETVHALSQRLVSLEQRLLSLEEQLLAVRLQPRRLEESEAATLAPIEAHIEHLLQDCRQLLAEQPSAPAPAPSLPEPREEDWEIHPAISGALHSEADTEISAQRHPSSAAEEEDFDSLEVA